MRFLRGVTLAALVAGALGFTAPALAQSVIEEVVVTAQRREQSLTDVPVAVSVLGQQTIERSFSNNLEELQALVPSVSFRTGNTTRNSALTVRGIGTISFSVGAEPSVSTVVDGVVLGRSGQAFGDLYDLERIEVLRGPQGTLFGKNASAGVVNITTQRPGEEINGYVDASYFEDNEYRVRARVAGPFTDNLRASLTVLNSRFDGYIDNVWNNQTVNGYDRDAFRVMVEYDVTDNIEALFIFEDYEADNDCCADLEARPSGRNPDSEAAPSGDGLDLGQRRVDHDFQTRTLDSTTAFSMQLRADLDNYSLISITAQRAWDNTEFREGDFTSIAGDSTLPVFGVPFQLHDIGPQEWRQFSQEFRIESNTGNAFEWQAGLFYWNIDSERNFTRFASCQNNNGQLDAAIRNHIEFTLDQGDPSQAEIDAFIADNGITCNANDIVDATGFMQTEFDNFAVFADGTYNLTDTLTLLGGLRYTVDDVSYSHNRRNNDIYGRRGVGVRPRFGERNPADPDAPPNNQSDTNFDGSTDENNVSGRIGVQWQFADWANTYVTYATGYKGPAFNVFYNMDPDDIAPIAAEESDAIEVGLKMTFPFGLFNFAWYDTEIDNFQANDFDDSDGTTITGFTNGGTVTTTGIEFDFLWQPTDVLSFTGGFALSDAESTTGAPLPFAPDTKVSAAFSWEFPLAGGSRFQLDGNYVYTDEKLSGNIGQEDEVPFLLPDYSILNGAFGWYSADEHLSLTLIGKNLTDESFTTTYSGDGFRYQIPRDASRYFGVNFRLGF